MSSDEAVTGAPVARLVERESFRMLGGRLDLIASVEPPAGDAVVLRSRMDPGSTVPLHSHRDPECFVVLQGEIEAFADDGGGWRTVQAGRSISMENGIAHSVRGGPEGADILIVTNRRLAQFFREAQAPSSEDDAQKAPGRDEVARVVETSRAFGYWMASPEEHERTTGRPLKN